MNQEIIPPQAKDIEKVILGAMLIDERGIDEAFEILKPEIFYDKKQREIYKAIEALYLRNDAIDMLTVSTELRNRGKLEFVGGDYQVIQLSQKVSSSAHIEYHCRIIQQKYIQRELIANSKSITKEAYSEGTDVFDLLDKAYTHLNSVSDILIKNKEIDVKEMTADIVDYAGKLYRGEVESGIPTPIQNLTQKMGGWRNSELIILAARPGMGKTAFAIKSGWVAALRGLPVGFFSLEMSGSQLLSRLWSMDLHIENDKFIKHGLDEHERKRVITRATEFEEIPFYIDDEPALSIKTLSVKAKKWKKEKGIKMLIVDYLQLMSGTGSKSNREQDVSKISRGLKLLAKELDLPVIALSQLSRAVEQRGGAKRPLLSDLRESGAIEQDADVVQFIYRPEYYGEETWDDYQSEFCAGQAEYIVAKNRNGELVRNRMKFAGKYTDFTDIDDFDEVIEPSKPEPNHDMNNAFDSDDDMPF